MEDEVYICEWEQTKKGFRLRTTSRPRVVAEGATYEEAEERLIEAIMDNGGAMHPVMQFRTPLPMSARESRYLTPELYLICGDDRFETVTEGRKNWEWLDSFFAEPICRECGYAHSPRSDRQMQLAYRPSAAGAFGSIGDESQCHIEILSETFLELLTAEERRGLELLPVQQKRRGREFFELIGPSGPPFVATSELESIGWRCDVCEYRTWGYYVDGIRFNSAIAASDLPDPLPSVFTVGAVPEVQLCVTGERWREMMGQKGTKRFTALPLGIIPDEEVVRVPHLLTHKERVAASWAKSPWRGRT